MAVSSRYATWIYRQPHPFNRSEGSINMSKDISITPQDAAVGIIEEEGEWIIIEHKKRTSTDEDGDNPQSSRTATTQAANPQVVEQGDCLAESPLSDTVDDPTAARNTADGTTFKERKKEKKPRLEGSRGYYRSRGRGRGGEVRKYRYSGYKPPFWDTKPRRGSRSDKEGCVVKG